MNKTLLVLLWLVGVTFSAQNQVIFFEDFQQGIPATFQLVNGDGNTPATQVSFINNAWVGISNGLTGNNPAAVSTSWYSVPATADDWMITPAINLNSNATLSWSAFSPDPDFRDGYEVRISTTGNSPANFTTVLFSTGAEQTSPTTRTVDLTPYTGNTVYLAFRNNSFNKYLLFVDDVKVEQKPAFDLVLQSSKSPSPYTLIPRSQQKQFAPSATIVNGGNNGITNCKVFAALTKNNQLLKIDSSNISSIGVGLATTVNFPSLLTNDTGSYKLTYFTRISQVDGNPSNDSAVYTFVVVDSTYARDNSVITSSVSIGASSGEFGHTFELVNNSRVKAAVAYLNNPAVGVVTKFRLYNFSTSPGSLIDSTASYVTTLADSLNGKTLKLGFIGGTKLPAGTYLLAITEQGNKRINLGTADGIQSPKANWYRFFGNPFFRWASGEEYDSLSSSQSYTKVLALRLQLEDACRLTPDFGFVTKPTCTNTGSITVNYNSENIGPYRFSWSTGQTAATISGLVPAAYTVTATDAYGCKFSDIDTIKVVPINIGIGVLDVSCKGGSNGSATANANGGNGSYTYVWNTVPQQVGKTATGLKQGIYTVTVTDGSCVKTAIAPILEPSTSMNVSVIQRNNPTSAISSDGSITVDASGGQAPYEYVWNDSTVSASIANLSTGRYCVTATDSRGCEVEKCDTIGVGVSIADINNLQAAKVYPQPASELLNIEATTSNFTIRLTDIKGTALITQESEQNLITIQVANIPAGVYILQIQSPNGVLFKKIIIGK